MRIGVLAGEASGDILGARLISALRPMAGELQVEGIGGPLMQAQGLSTMFPMERLSVMGFTEPLARLPELLRIRGAVFRHFRDNPPDLFIGIDSPDFNLRLERKLRDCGVKTVHLVSPSVWAWRQWRVHGIRRAVDLMLCLFPFELDIYRENRIPAVFVGHPLADELPLETDRGAARAALALPADARLVALLPGSRGGEVSRLAPLFLQAAALLYRNDPGLRFALPAASAARGEQLRTALERYPQLPVQLFDGRSREVMAAADAVLVASGTATLEAMLLGRPMVVAYRLGGLSWWLMSRLVKTGFVALPNVLAGRELVPELLQDAATPQALATALSPLLESGDARDRQLGAFADIHRSLRCDFARSSAQALMQLAAGEGGHG